MQAKGHFYSFLLYWSFGFAFKQEFFQRLSIDKTKARFEENPQNRELIFEAANM